MRSAELESESSARVPDVARHPLLPAARHARVGAQAQSSARAPARGSLARSPRARPRACAAGLRGRPADRPLRG
eukprot:scaffold98991_cov48-Phaeocystis_antarctica.AAC.1